MVKILEINSLEKHYPKFSLDIRKLTFMKGKITGVVGPNGAGKSTLFKSIMGLISRDSGEILYRDNPIEKDPIFFRKNIGYVGEYLEFYEKITCKKIASFKRKFYDNWDSKTYENLMNRMSVDETKMIGQLSKGMKVKFSLAMALAHKPDLLILDEPTSGLDPIVRDELLNIIRKEVEDRKCSVIFSSHIIEDIQSIADSVVFIRDGKVVLEENKNTIIDGYVSLDASVLNERTFEQGIVLRNDDLLIVDSERISEHSKFILSEKTMCKKMSVNDLLLAINNEYVS